MALTRKSLKAMGIEDEKIDQIIEDHSETVEALKQQRDRYQKEAEKVPSLEKELEAAKANEGDDFKEKYEAEREAFEAYKSEVKAKETQAQTEAMYKELLQEAGIDSKRIASVLKVSDLSDVKIKDGEIVDKETIIEKIKNDWSDFIVSTDTKGAGVDTPPTTGGAKMSKEEILKIKDAGERQKAMAENHEAFGF